MLLDAVKPDESMEERDESDDHHDILTITTMGLLVHKYTRSGDFFYCESPVLCVLFTSFTLSRFLRYENIRMG